MSVIFITPYDSARPGTPTDLCMEAARVRYEHIHLMLYYPLRLKLLRRTRRTATRNAQLLRATAMSLDINLLPDYSARVARKEKPALDKAIAIQERARHGPPYREKYIGGSGGSLEPPGRLLEPPGPLLTHLHTVYIAYSECLLTRLNPLAERTCFSQATSTSRPRSRRTVRRARTSAARRARRLTWGDSSRSARGPSVGESR